MERKEFISNIGLSIAAICTGCLAACSKSVSAPSSVNFTIDLSVALTNIGDSVTKSGVIVVRISASNNPGSFSAVQVACTHEGAAVNYNKSASEFLCPLHGSRFSLSGAVLQGPATRSLQQYNISITGNILTVTS